MVDYRLRNQELLDRVSKRLRRIYMQAARDAALIGATVRLPKTKMTFSLNRYPSVRKKIDRLIAELHAKTRAVVMDGIREAWRLAEEQNEDLVRQYFGPDITEAQVKKYLGGTQEALEAFLSRKAGGLGLSERVWNYSSQYRDEIETALGIGISNGDSAAKMARDMQGYLKYPDRLFRRVRDNDGALRLSKPARLFHPGQGVYRSSFANARRLAVNETNLAYHTADYQRWQSLDFVVGIKVTPSGSHPCPDICDQLAGYYPKDFKFTGWHPMCMCHATSVLKTREEMTEDTRRILSGQRTVNWSRRSVTSVPNGFATWVRQNEGKIHAAKSRPYFVNDNIAFVRGVLLGNDSNFAAEEVAAMTPDELKDRITSLQDAMQRGQLPKDSARTIAEIQKMGADNDAAIRAKLSTLDAAVSRHIMRDYTGKKEDIAKAWDSDRLGVSGETAKAKAVNDEIKKQPVKSVEDVDRIMQTYCSQFPNEFGDRCVPITSFNTPRTSPNAPYRSGGSFHNKEISFNEAPDKGAPGKMTDIINAFEDARRGYDLTGTDLNAFRTMQHELLHQKASGWMRLNPEGHGDYKRFAMETMNEMAARAKLPQFLRRLGVSSINSSNLMYGGVAYQDRMNRFLQFIDDAGLNPYSVGHSFENEVTTLPYDSLDDVLYKFIKDHVKNAKDFTQSKEDVFKAMSAPDTDRTWQSYLKEWFG